MKKLYITQVGMKLFGVTQNSTKMFHLAQFEWSYCHSARVDLVCWNFAQIFSNYGNVF